MALTPGTRDTMLDQLSTLVTHASLHTADPGSTGTSEVTGGSYARVAVTWAASSGGTKNITAAVTFQVPAGTTITHFGMWSASSGGTFRGGGALDAPQSYPTGGTFDLSITVPST
jgi:hypothetical protein